MITMHGGWYVRRSLVFVDMLYEHMWLYLSICAAGSDIKAEEFVEPQVELECFFAGEEETPKSNSGYKLRRCKPECLARRSKSEGVT